MFEIFCYAMTYGRSETIGVLFVLSVYGSGRSTAKSAKPSQQTPAATGCASVPPAPATPQRAAAHPKPKAKSKTSGRSVKVKPVKSPVKSIDQLTSRELRAIAHQHGIPCGSRGRISQSVIAQLKEIL